MLILLARITALFAVSLITLLAAKRSTAATRHLLCVCALAGSLILPVAALFPATVIALRLPAIDAVAASPAIARAGTWPSSTAIPALWAFGCIVLLVRLAIGHWRISRLIRSATRIKPALFIADVGVPIACRLFRPVVLMPRSSSEWPDWQFDAAVRHELMHISHGDLWAGCTAQLACAVYWFHPLVWTLSRHLHKDQESACDDAVLLSGVEPANYAQALLAVAQTSASLSTPTLLPGCPMTTQFNLKTRIARLLDRSIARNTSRTNLLRTAIGFAILLAGIGTLSLQKSSAQSPVYKVGGDVTAPRVIYRVDPAYTEEAHQAKIAGTVLLSVVVGADGQAHDISILRSLDPGLDRKAAEAIQQWRFAPGTLMGEPVAVTATIEVNFKLL
jgi:TonB family protein